MEFRRKTKQFIGALLAAVMMLSCMPVSGLTAWAAEATGKCTGDHTGWTAWTSDLELPTEPGKYYLTKDVSVWIGEGQKYWRVPAGEITICLNGHSIMNASTPSSGDAGNSYLIAVDNGATLNLCDCQGSGYVERPSSSYGAICVLPDAVFNMYGGSIRNSGIGVYIDKEHATTYDRTNSGRFNMYGGTILGCSTASVYVNSLLRPNGGFYMYGGTLSTQVYIVNLTGSYSSNNFNTLHYFDGTIYGDPQVFLSNKKSIFVGAPLSEPLRIKVNEESGFTIPDGKLIVAEPGYTLTDADALQVRCPGGTRIPVVDTASNSIVLKEVTPLSSDALTLNAINYGQQAKEAVLSGSVTIDGTTPLAGRLWIDDETVYNAGTHNVTVKFQPDGRSEELSYNATLTVNKVAPTLAWADDQLTQTVAKPRVKDEFTAPATNSNGAVSYAYRAADAADTAAWTDGLPKECGTYVVKAKQAEGTNYTAAESSNTVTLSVVDVPGAPTVHTATLSDAQAEITWDAPDYVGSSPITSYEVTWLRKGREVKKTETLPADALSAIFTITDKSENDWYQCEVKAINAAGAGEAGFQSPIYVSMEPVITRISVIRFNQNYVEGEKLDTQEVEVLLMYNYKGESNPLSEYVPLEQAVAMGGKLTLDGMDSPPKEIAYKEYFLTLGDDKSDLYLDMPTDLPEQTIRCKVGAINVGIAYPGAPKNLKATPGDQKLIVTWEEPAMTYGKETTGYHIVCKDGDTVVETKEVDSATQSVTFDGLTNEKTYTIEIRARNVDGYGETATIQGKPSPYATIRLTPKAQIVFGENVGDWINKVDETYNYTIDNSTDLEALTGLTVEFESEAKQLVDGDKLQVTFGTKAVDNLTYNYTPRVEITPTVKVIGPDGTEKTTHHYTFITPTTELEYLPRDISKDTCGIQYFQLMNNQYDGSSKITIETILLTLNGSNNFPNGKSIRRQDYTCEFLDQNRNSVEEIYLPGTYTVIMTGAGSCTGEYRTTLAIRKRSTIVKANKQTVEYGTAISSDAAMANLTSRGWKDQIKEITLTPESNQVGTWKITPSDVHIWNTEADEERTDCYNITGYQFGTLTITKAENPTLAFKEASITMEYNNGDPIPNPTEDMLTFTGAYYEDICFQWKDADGNVLASAPTGTGNYTLKAYLVDNENHGAAEATADVTVVGKRLNEANMTLAEGSFTYNGMAHTPTVTVKDGETVIDESKYTVTYESNTDAGIATVTVADADDTDVYEIGGTLTFTIAPCPLDGLEASVNHSDDIVYDGTEQTPDVTMTGPKGIALTAGIDYTVAYIDNLSAGTATAKITAVDGSNYTSTKTLTFTIAQKLVTPKLTGTTTKVYDGTVTASAGLAVTLDDVLDADKANLMVSATSMTYNSSNVADANTITAEGITLSGTAAGNYTLNGVMTATIPGTITNKPIAGAQVSLGTALIYNGNAQTQTIATVTVDGLTLTENDYTVIDNIATDAGTYQLKITGQGNFSGTMQVDYTVSRKGIDTPQAVTGLIYNGEVQAGIVADGCTLTDHTATNAGTYTASVTPDANHQWNDGGTETRNVEWSIAPKPITVTADNAQKVYGDSDPTTFTYTAKDLVDGDVLTGITCNRVVGEDVGDYEITAFQETNSNPNYAISFVKGTFTITKAPGNLSVTQSTVEKTYGDAAFSLGATHDGPGVVTYESNNENVATVDASGNVTLQNVGEANITVTLPETDNYLGGTVQVTLTVVRKQATLTITKIDYEVTYGDAAFTIGYTKESENTPEFTSNNTVVATVDQGGQVEIKGVGTAEITVKIPQSHNYKEVSQSVTVKVNPKPITVTAEDKNKTYGDADPAFTYTSMQLVGTDSLTDIKVSREKGEDAGEYTVTLTQEDGANPNYDITFVDGTLTIDPRVVQLEWKNTNLIYNGTEQKPEAAVTNLVEGDTCTVTVEGAETDAGSYTATATALDNNNYALPVDPAQVEQAFTILPKPVEVPTAKTGLVYNEVEQTGVAAGEGYTLTGNTGINAGDYTAVATLESNYCWQGLTNSDPQNIVWSIAKAPGNLSVTQSTVEKTYGDAAFSLGATHDGPGVVTYTSDNTDVATVGTDGTVTLQNVGEANITVTLPETDNYLSDQAKVTLTVVRKQATLTITKIDYEVTYGDAAFNIGYTKESENAPQFTSDNTVVATVDQGGQVEIQGVGTAQIAVKIPESPNYKEVSQTVTVKVNPKKITVTAEDKNKTYGEPDPELTYTSTTLVGEDGLTGITATRQEGEDAGEYTVTLTQKEGANPNYDVEFVTGKLTIQPKGIGDAAIVLGPALTANGKEQIQTLESVTVKNSQGEDMEVTYTVTGHTAVKAGGYTMTVTGTGNFTGTKEQSFVIAPGAGQPIETDDSGNPVLGEGKITEQVIPKEGAPTVNAGTSKEEIIGILTQSGCLTAQELAQVADGAELKIIFTTSGSVSAEDQRQITALADGYTVGSWFDISLYKQLGKGEIVWLHETGKPIHLTVQIPENLINTDQNVTRTFWMIRCHDGNAEFLPVQYDDSSKTLSFETDRFSGYAIVYKDTKNTDSSPNTATGTVPQTGDSSRVDLWLAMAAMSALGLGIVLNVNRKKKRIY